MSPRFRVLPLVSLVVPLVLRAQAAPDAADLLARSDDLLFNAKTMRLAGDRTQDRTIGAGQPIHNASSFTFEIQGGGRARDETIEGNATTVTVFDGSNLWTYRSANNTYTRSPANRMRLASSPFDFGFDFLVAGRNPGNINSATVEGQEQVSLAGAPVACYVVSANYTGVPVGQAARNVVRKVWISRDQNLVLRDNWVYEITVNSLNMKISSSTDYTKVEWDIPLAADRFTFQPPAGSSLAGGPSPTPIGAVPVNIGGIPAGGAPDPPTPAPTPVQRVFPAAVVSRIEPQYTTEARAAALQGTVSLYAAVNPDGTPGDIRVLYGLGLGLDEQAVQALRQWRFKPAVRAGEALRLGQSVDIGFRLDDGGPWRVRLAAYSVTHDKTRREVLDKPVLTKYTAPDPVACPAGGGFTLVDLTIGTNGLIKSVKPQTPGDKLGEAAAKAIALWRFRPGTANGAPRESNGSVEFECGPAQVPEPAALTPGRNITNPIPVFRPEPMYSEAARKAKLSGMVVVSLVVDATGHTRDIHVLSPLGLGLDEEAVAAAKRWRFKPGTKDGQPVNVMAQIQITFRLL